MCLYKDQWLSLGVSTDCFAYLICSTVDGGKMLLRMTDSRLAYSERSQLVAGRCSPRWLPCCEPIHCIVDLCFCGQPTRGLYSPGRPVPLMSVSLGLWQMFVHDLFKVTHWWPRCCPCINQMGVGVDPSVVVGDIGCRWWGCCCCCCWDSNRRHRPQLWRRCHLRA